MSDVLVLDAGWSVPGTHRRTLRPDRGRPGGAPFRCQGPFNASARSAIGQAPSRFRIRRGSVRHAHHVVGDCCSVRVART